MVTTRAQKKRNWQQFCAKGQLNTDCLAVIAEHCDVQTALKLAATSKTNWKNFGFNADRTRSGMDSVIDHIGYHFKTMRRYYLDCLWVDDEYLNLEKKFCDFDDYFFNYYWYMDVPVHITIKDWVSGARPCGPGHGMVHYDPEERR